jgi:hypothetical protein
MRNFGSGRIIMTRLVVAFVLAGLAPLTASAQPLADVARAEAERRKSVTASGKVYTNDNLRPDLFTPAPSVVPEAPVSGDVEAVSEVPAASEPARDEAYWSARIGAAREQLQRSRMFADALQSRINGLNADFVARDDPSQRAAIADERERALAELDRVNGEIQDLARTIADIQEEARREGVPPGWLRDRS